MINAEQRKTALWADIMPTRLELAGVTHPDEFDGRAVAELIEIYHAQNADPAVRPPLVK